MPKDLEAQLLDAQQPNALCFMPKDLEAQLLLMRTP